VDVTARPDARRRSELAETALSLRAIELGWEPITQSTARQAFRRRAAARAVLAELEELVSQAAGMKWSLSHLQIRNARGAPGEVAVTATFERRLEATIGAATREALARRQAAGVRLGRRPLIPDAVLAQIARDREAGKGYSRIAAELQAAGVPTAQGGLKWRASTVRAAYLRATQAPSE
jgi:hypothetical protein